MSITHAKVSTQPEGSNPNKVNTSDWNDDHEATAITINPGAAQEFEDYLTVNNRDGKPLLRMGEIDGFGRMIYAQYENDFSGFAVLCPDIAGVHLISFDLNDGDGGYGTDLGSVRYENGQNGGKKASLWLLKPSVTGDTAVGNAILQGDGTLLLQKPTGYTTPAIELKTSTGSTLFRVDADGTVHIKTGTSIVADL